MSGRPLRFLGLVTGGWVATRVLLLWHETGSLPEAIRQVVPVAASRTAVPVPASPRPALAAARSLWLAPHASLPTVRAAPASLARISPAVDPRRVQLALLAMSRFGPVEEVAEPGAAPAPQSASPALAAIAAQPGRRWSASAWLIARGGTGTGASSDAPQLGGAQGGLRIDYAVGHGIAATGRIAAPAAGAGREASLGIAWRPGKLPIRLVAEQRVALDRGRGGPAVGISGGIYTRLPAGFRLEGYAQGGAIFRNGTERYVDGLVRAARPVTRAGGLEVDLGIGGWGGAQRGVARLDVGPSAGLRVPLADRTVRLSLDWRQRIAGDARPGSGPALTIGSDF